MGDDISRRGFLGLVGKAFGVAAVASVSSLFPNIADARSSLHIQYEMRKNPITKKDEPALKIPLRYGVSYALLSGLYTGTEKNTRDIQIFNGNKRLVNGQNIYIPKRLLDNKLLSILDKNKFVTFEIETQGEQGIGTLWDVADTLMNDTYENNTKVRLLLILNDEINPTNGFVREDQKILVPTSLINTDKIVNDKSERPDLTPLKEKPKTVPKPPQAPTLEVPKRYGTQNPFRCDVREIRRKIKARDKFGAGRLRDLGKGKFRASKHTGLDLVSPIGTRLYPIAQGRVTKIGYAARRNGNFVFYMTRIGNEDLEVAYLHMRNECAVKTGQKIDRNTLLGYVGVTGNANASYPHVHIQVKRRISGKWTVVNPEQYVVVDTN